MTKIVETCLDSGTNQTKCANFNVCKNLHNWNFDKYINEKIEVNQIRMILCEGCLKQTHEHLSVWFGLNNLVKENRLKK